MSVNENINMVLVRFSKPIKTGKFLGMNTVNYLFYQVQKDWFTTIFNISPRMIYNYSPRLKNEIEKYLLYNRSGKYFETITKRFMKYYAKGVWRNIEEVRVLPHSDYGIIFRTLDVLATLQIPPEVMVQNSVRVLYSHTYTKKIIFHKSAESKSEDALTELINTWARPLTFWSNESPFLNYSAVTPYGRIQLLTPLFDCGFKDKRKVVTFKDVFDKFVKNAQVVDKCKLSYYTDDTIYYINGSVYYYHGLVRRLEVINETMNFETEIIDNLKELNNLIEEQLPIYYEVFKKYDTHGRFARDYDYFAKKWGLPVGKCIEVGDKYIFPLIVLKSPDEVESAGFGLNGYIKFRLSRGELKERLVLVILPKKDFEKVNVMCDFYSVYI